MPTQTCQHCGLSFEVVDKPVTHYCAVLERRTALWPPGLERTIRTGRESRPQSTPEEPGLLRKAVNFTKAAVDHARKGFTRVSDEVVTARFNVCSSNTCGFYKSLNNQEGQCLHPSCGCSLKPVGISGKNKLRWAEQQCPVGLWQTEPTNL